MIIKDKNIDIIEFAETILDCKLHDFQKELIKNMYSKSGVPSYLIIPRQKLLNEGAISMNYLSEIE